MSSKKTGLRGPHKTKPGKPKDPFPKYWLEAKPVFKDLGKSWEVK